MRKTFTIKKEKLSLLEIDGYGSDIALGGMNMIDEILFWMEHEGITVDERLVRPMMTEFTFEVTDGA